MSSLYAFLNAETAEKTKEVIVSTRFKDENGKVVPFVIKNLTQEKNNENISKSTKFRNVGGMTTDYLDTVLLAKRTIVESTVYPDFRAKELCEHYGTLDPLEVPGKMLTAGEYNTLMEAIRQLSENDEELTLDDAKN
jgi:hypothetical protein